MSDERELPERVWIDWKYALPSADGEVGTWMSSPATEDDVPYLRADKPAFYVVSFNGERVHAMAYGKFATEEEALRLADMDDTGKSTAHPVYIGPAIEPGEESDE